LIVNSDSPKNRGDRAILAGLIEVVRNCWPDARIEALSQHSERDAGWFGINFLDQSPLSVGPVDYLRLLRAARRADVILWGGGELLKDYTNRLGLVYWAVKLTGLRLANGELHGAFQGIGPTGASSSRRLIVYAVNRTKTFITRDEESARKLRSWGTRTRVTASFDPAVMAPTAEWSPGLAERVERALGVDRTFLDNAVGLGVRRWFHYRHGGWLPFSVRKHTSETAQFRLYRDNLVAVLDRITDGPDANVVFVPMHMKESEADAAFARDLVARMRHPERARVLDADTFAPAEVSAILGRCRYVIASRLHAAIVAACSRVPAVVLYYVPKGRVFYEQLGMAELALPIEAMLEDDGVDQVLSRAERVLAERESIVAAVDAKVKEMARQVVADAQAAWRR
jgi:polysaccharide pyruvyl transferase WcaK-like protein